MELLVLFLSAQGTAGDPVPLLPVALFIGVVVGLALLLLSSHRRNKASDSTQSR